MDMIWHEVEEGLEGLGLGLGTLSYDMCHLDNLVFAESLQQEHAQIVVIELWSRHILF